MWFDSKVTKNKPTFGAGSDSAPSGPFGEMRQLLRGVYRHICSSLVVVTKKLRFTLYRRTDVSASASDTSEPGPRTHTNPPIDRTVGPNVTSLLNPCATQKFKL